jgi:hypothetical protein
MSVTPTMGSIGSIALACALGIAGACSYSLPRRVSPSELKLATQKLSGAQSTRVHSYLQIPDSDRRVSRKRVEVTKETVFRFGPETRVVGALMRECSEAPATKPCLLDRLLEDSAGLNFELPEENWRDVEGVLVPTLGVTGVALAFGGLACAGFCERGSTERTASLIALWTIAGGATLALIHCVVKRTCRD